MKGCDSFIKWQGPPRKLAKEVFVEFIAAKEKSRFAKEWRMVLAKDHVIRIESHEVCDTAYVRCIEIRPNLKQTFIPGALNLFSRELLAANQIAAMLPVLGFSDPTASF